MAKGERRVRVMWIDLPKELLELILGRLVFTDHPRFRAVCKTWRSIDHVIPMKQLPWIMMCIECRINRLSWPNYKGSLRSWQLFNPSSEKSYSIEIEGILDLSTIEVCSSKHGWLLLSQVCSSRDPYGVFFLFNPFTKERINLPNLVFKSTYHATTFSSLPTSPDCLVLNIDHDFNNHMGFIRTCRCGDEAWTTQTFESFKINYHFIAMSDRNSAFFNGMFYFFNSYNALAVFNVAECRMSVLEKPADPSPFDPCECYLVESDGELLFVYVCQRGSWANVWRLDQSQMGWINVESLGNRSLFIGGRMSFSINMKMDGFESGIYFRSESRNATLFLSLKPGSSCHSFDPYNPSELHLTTNYSFAGRHVPLEKIWIETP